MQHNEITLSKIVEFSFLTMELLEDPYCMLIDLLESPTRNYDLINAILGLFDQNSLENDINDNGANRSEEEECAELCEWRLDENMHEMPTDTPTLSSAYFILQND